MAKSFLITGASGFVSGHLIQEILRTEGSDVRIAALDITEPDLYFLDESQKSVIEFHKANLADPTGLQEVLATFQPENFIHLAAMSSVAASWKEPVESFNNNMNIFLNILEAVRAASPKTRILSVGSSEQYGVVDAADTPLKESAQPNPISPYAVARVAQEYMCNVYVKGFGLDIVMTRSFNHIGPRQGDKFVMGSFARQVAEIAAGKREPVIETGDLGITRDFTDVRDVVKAYLMLLEKGAKGRVYNICSGTGRTLRQCLDALIAIQGVQCEVRTDPALLRPADNPVIVGDNSRMRQEIGWSPQIVFEDTLSDSLAFWSERIAG